MNKSDCYFLGSIIKVFGYAGELVFLLDVDNPSNYKKLKSVLVEINNNLVPFFIQKIKVQGEHAWVKLEDVDNEEQAGELIGNDLYLPLSDLPKLKGKRFYFHEIIGFTVIDENHGRLGVIDRIFDMPQQAVANMLYMEKEVMFPLSGDFVKKVDRENKEFHVRLPEGLLEIYLD